MHCQLDKSLAVRVWDRCGRDNWKRALEAIVFWAFRGEGWI